MTLTDIIKNSITFSDKGDDRYVQVFGNRINLLSYVVGSYGTVFFYH